MKPKAKPYRGKFNKQFLANKAAVWAPWARPCWPTSGPRSSSRARRSSISCRPRAHQGRGQSAARLLFNADNTYKSKAEIEAIAKPIVGADLDKEIIVYCDTGKVCTTWWLALHDLLGYKNVKVYDGSSMEWLADPAAPREP